MKYGKCDRCGGPFEFEDEHQGEVIDCPHCGDQSILFPNVSQKESSTNPKAHQNPGVANGLTPKEFRVTLVVECALGTIFLGASKLPLEKMQQTLNKYGNEGWDLAFMIVEKKRLLLFWEREAVVLTFSRPKA